MLLALCSSQGQQSVLNNDLLAQGLSRIKIYRGVTNGGGGGGGGVIGIAQSAWVRSNASPMSVTLPNVGSGSVIAVLVFKAGQGMSATTLSDGVAAYTLDYGFDAGSTPRLGAYSRRTASAGSVTIWVTNTAAGNQMAAAAYEITNAASSGWFDGGTTGTGTGTAEVSAQFNTSGAGVVLCMTVDGSGSNPTTKSAGTGYAISAAGAAHEDNAITYWSTMAQHGARTVGQYNTNATCTLGTSQSWNLMAVSYVGIAAGNQGGFVDAETGNDGDSLTTNMLTTVTKGTGKWWSGPTSGQLLTGAKIKTGVNVQGGAVIAGTNYAGNGTRALSFRNDIYEFAEYQLPAAVSNCSMGFWWTPGVTNESIFCDEVTMFGSLDFAVLSIQSTGTTNVPVKLHTNAGSSVGTINVMSTGTTPYWVTMLYAAGDLSRMRIYDGGLAQVGSEVSITTVAYPVAVIRIGEHHSLTANPTVSFYDSIIVDSQKAAFPLLPILQ